MSKTTPTFRLLPVTAAVVAFLLGASAHAACSDTAAAATATAGSACTATGSTYTNGTYALESNGAGSSLTVTGAVSLNPGGANATTGGRAVASADGSGSALTFNGNVAIVQRGATNSYGLSAGNVTPGGTGTVQVNGTLKVEMAAGGSTRRAVMAYQAGSVVTIVGATTITSTGGSSHRGFSAEDGIINYSSASIDFSGQSGSLGIRSTTALSQVNATGNTVITVDSAGSYGVAAFAGAINLTGKLTVNAGAGSDAAVYDAALVSMGPNSVLNNPTGNAVVLSGSPTFTAGSGLAVTGGTNGFSYSGVSASTISLTNATVTAPNLWNAASSSVATFNGTGGTYTGASAKDAGSTLNVNLSGGALWNLTADATLTAATLASSAVLSSPTASRTLTGNLANTGGTLDLHGAAPGTAGQVFTVAGNYSGGGVLQVDTQLGDSSSPTDSLVVTGDVSGVTTLQVTNVGGTGAATTGNGIPVVRVTGSSPAGAFVLPAPGYVQAGGWRYTLVQVGQDWFLQSQAAPVSASSDVAAVPTLSVWALWALSPLLMLLGGRRRRG